MNEVYISLPTFPFRLALWNPVWIFFTYCPAVMTTDMPRHGCCDNVGVNPPEGHNAGCTHSCCDLLIKCHNVWNGYYGPQFTKGVPPLWRRVLEKAMQLRCHAPPILADVGLLAIHSISATIRHTLKVLNFLPNGQPNVCTEFQNLWMLLYDFNEGSSWLTDGVPTRC